MEDETFDDDLELQDDAGGEQPDQPDHAERVAERLFRRGRNDLGQVPASAAGEEGDAGLPAEPTRREDTAAPRSPLDGLHAAHRERLSRKQEMRRLEEENRSLREAMQAALAAAPTPEPTVEPVPDFDTDPAAWYEYQQRQSEKRLAERLKPLDDLLAGTKAQREQAEEAQARQAQAQEWLRERGQLVAEAEEEYLATPQGDGYLGRFEEFQGRIYTHMLGLAGGDEARADRATRIKLDSFIEEAIRLGQHPIAYLDSVMATHGIVNGAGRVTNGHRAAAPASPAAPTRRQPAVDPATSGLTTSLGAQTPKSGPRGPGKLPATAKELRSALRNPKNRGDIRQQIRDLHLQAR